MSIAEPFAKVSIHTPHHGLSEATALALARMVLQVLYNTEYERQAELAPLLVERIEELTKPSTGDSR
jgi:hypothetical protein